MPFFSQETNGFLQRLADNNNRDWFDSNKADYRLFIQQPADDFAMTMTAALEAETGRIFAAKIFRIYRDVRFSKDKRPYNCHVRIAFTAERGASAPGYFFSLEPDHLMLGAGVFGYASGELDNFRRRIDGAKGSELQKILDKLSGIGMRLSDPELKRTPPPYPADHQRAALLRHKGLTAWIDSVDAQAAYGPDGFDTCLAEFKKLQPLFDWMSISVAPR